MEQICVYFPKITLPTVPSKWSLNSTLQYCSTKQQVNSYNASKGDFSKLVKMIICAKTRESWTKSKFDQKNIFRNKKIIGTFSKFAKGEQYALFHVSLVNNNLLGILRHIFCRRFQCHRLISSKIIFLYLMIQSHLKGQCRNIFDLSLLCSKDWAKARRFL